MKGVDILLGVDPFAVISVVAERRGGEYRLFLVFSILDTLIGLIHGFFCISSLYWCGGFGGDG